MIPSPSDLQYFIEVANTLNISRASERLGISQPTLSLAIKRLEDSFGVPLLIRGKSGVQLTHSGQRLLTHARALLLEWENIRGEALKAETHVSGRYSIGCHQTVALACLPKFLPKLLADNPLLEIKLTHDLSRRITEDVISFKSDFGIVVNPSEHPDLFIKSLYKDEVTLWNSSKYHSEQTDPHSGEGVLICDTDLLQTQALLKQFERKGMKFKRVVTSPSLEVIASLTASGIGVGVLPNTTVRALPKEASLKVATKDGPRYSDQICLIYRPDAQKSKASKTIARAIEAALIEK